MPQFAATIKHIQEGVKGFTVSAAVKNIEGWEDTLGKMDTPGTQGILRDLGALKKQLHAEPIDGDAVMKLVGKLGKETVTLAGKAKSKNAEQVKKLGEALNGMASERNPEA